MVVTLYVVGAWGYCAGFVSGRKGISFEFKLADAHAKGQGGVIFAVDQLTGLALAVGLASKLLERRDRLTLWAAGFLLFVLVNTGVILLIYG